MTGLKRPLRPPDWSDTHRAPVRDELATARAAYELAFGSTSFIGRWAMKLRNGIVGLVGLATPVKAKGMIDLPCVREADTVFELGLIDRHLTFTIETIIAENVAAMTTRIWFNHWTGRLYLAIVLIPHKIMMRLALRRLA